MLTTDVQPAVVQEIIALLDEDTVDELGEVTADTELSALGLNSLAFARLIIKLETVLGADPFGGGGDFIALRTVGALAQAYEQAASNRMGV
ncbi:phosphopantetheine-binding protein [Streptomyces sp. NPDC016566]|uniref:phosphopantetheine-binding protein n=1 Tax=Streptomyces sp. NPDC016566 TaxID=3364967 RepID=UPI0036F7B67A